MSYKLIAFEYSVNVILFSQDKSISIFIQFSYKTLSRYAKESIANAIYCKEVDEKLNFKQIQYNKQNKSFKKIMRAHWSTRKAANFKLRLSCSVDPGFAWKTLKDTIDRYLKHQEAEPKLCVETKKFYCKRKYVTWHRNRILGPHSGLRPIVLVMRT